MIETLAILVAAAVLGFLALALYFAPTLIVGWRGQGDLLAVLVLNILLGWTGVAWVALLLWALTHSDPEEMQHARTH